MKDRKNFLGHLALWGTAFIWGTSFVILKEALDSIGTMWVLALRFIIAAALLLLAAGKRLKTLGRDACAAACCSACASPRRIYSRPTA